jgi:hypothetical protein
MTTTMSTNYPLAAFLPASHPMRHSARHSSSLVVISSSLVSYGMPFLFVFPFLYITELPIMNVYRHVPYLNLISALLPQLLLSLPVVILRVPCSSLSVQVSAALSRHLPPWHETYLTFWGLELAGCSRSGFMRCVCSGCGAALAGVRFADLHVY